MSKRAALLILMVLTIVGALAALRLLEPPAQPHAETQSRPLTARQSPPTGVASCSGRSCHGSLEPTANPSTWQAEYTRWLSHDPHARAYHILLEPRSQDIARRLGLPAAHTAQECLACHVTPRLAPDHGGSMSSERLFGVSCEACHGKAEGWIDAHLTEAWRKKSASEKQQLGMTALADPTVLAQTCAGCHVGAPPGAEDPARDVNHDLIAAGHPRLAFEVTSYFANLPRHWRQASDSRRDSPGGKTAVDGLDEARLWAVGQAVAAESALTLLQHRAASKDVPWPEFAEYDCAACHHRLATPSSRQPAAGVRPGAPAWGTWSLAMVPALAELSGHDVKLPALDELRRRLSEWPSRETAAPSAAAALTDIAQLRRRLADMPLDQLIVATWLKRLTKHPLLDEGLSWDRAEQTFLALYALNQSVNADDVRQRIARLAEVRVLPPGYDSPRGFDASRFLKLLRD
jgi:hypothetical protein